MNYYTNRICLMYLLAINFLINTNCAKLFLQKDQKAAQNQHYFITNKLINHAAKDQDQSIEDQLMEAANSIEKSLAKLAASQEINNIPVLNTAPLITPEGGMGHTADIDWTGPIEPLLQKIAEMTNYSLKVLGNPTPLPIIVSITQSNAIVADLLKNASLQAGNRANIVVFPANRIIELRYRFNLPNNHKTDQINEQN